MLQLTNYKGSDTGAAGLSADGQRVLFMASANPLGTNPSKRCQICSIDRLGGQVIDAGGDSGERLSGLQQRAERVQRLSHWIKGAFMRRFCCEAVAALLGLLPALRLRRLVPR